MVMDRIETYLNWLHIEVLDDITLAEKRIKDAEEGLSNAKNNLGNIIAESERYKIVLMNPIEFREMMKDK